MTDSSNKSNQECPSCQFVLPSGAVFCPSCGAEISSPATAKPAPQGHTLDANSLLTPVPQAPPAQSTMQVPRLTEESFQHMVSSIQNSAESTEIPTSPANATMAIGAFSTEPNSAPFLDETESPEPAKETRSYSQDDPFWALPDKQPTDGEKPAKTFAPEDGLFSNEPPSSSGLAQASGTSDFAPIQDIVDSSQPEENYPAPPQPLDEPSTSPIKQTFMFSSDKLAAVEQELLGQQATEIPGTQETPVAPLSNQTVALGADIVDEVRASLGNNPSLPTPTEDEWAQAAAKPMSSTQGFSADLSQFLHKEEDPKTPDSNPTLDDLPPLQEAPASFQDPAPLAKQTMVMAQENISEWMQAQNVSLEEEEELEDATETLAEAERAVDQGEFTKAIDLYMLLVRHFPEESQYQERIKELWDLIRSSPEPLAPPSSSSNIEKFLALAVGLVFAVGIFGFVWPGFLREKKPPTPRKANPPVARKVKRVAPPKKEGPATLQISSSPSGASIWVDGSQTRWKTPATFRRPKGNYVLTLRMEGYKPLRMQIRLQSDQRFAAEFALAEIPKGIPPRRRIVRRGNRRRTFRLVTTPADANFLLDGKLNRRTTPARLRLRYGTYQLQVQKDGYNTYIRELKVNRRTPRTLSITLTKQPATGTLQLQTRPSGVSVSLNGAPTGKKTPVTLTVTQGSNKIGFSKPGFRSMIKTIQVQRGKDQKLSVRLRRKGPQNMVWVRSGTFLMGNNTGLEREKPMRKVKLRGYYIDKYEVTVEDYKRCVAAKACRAPSNRRGCNARYPNRKKHPINCVNWYEARTYCRWAGKRLPTEAEWEKAARGTSPRTYPWGYSSPSCKKSRFRRCRPLRTHPVGSLPGGRSPFGAFDMSGNVWEWVRDKFDANYYQREENVNPVNTRTGGMYYVIRGGSYKSSGDRVHATFRSDSWARQRVPTVGFRCAK